MADSWLELESQEAFPARDMQFQIQREAGVRIRGSSVTCDAADTRLGKWLHEFRESGGGFVARARIAARAPGLNPCCRHPCQTSGWTKRPNRNIQVCAR